MCSCTLDSRTISRVDVRAWTLGSTREDLPSGILLQFLSTVRPSKNNFNFILDGPFFFISNEFSKNQNFFFKKMKNQKKISFICYPLWTESPCCNALLFFSPQTWSSLFLIFSWMSFVLLSKSSTILYIHQHWLYIHTYYTHTHLLIYIHMQNTRVSLFSKLKYKPTN